MTMDILTKDTFTHVFEMGHDARRAPVLLLHGTGGDENDLLPLGRMVAPGASLLSPRGRVLEGAMPRFFCRKAEGVFDEDDLIARTHELADFILAARSRYDIDAPVALGFSNGANIAASLLMLRPNVLAGAALIRAMPPFRTPPSANLENKPVLMLSGALDPLVPGLTATLLADALSTAGARVEHQVLPTGHGLSQGDLTALSRWFAQLTHED